MNITYIAGRIVKAIKNIAILGGGEDELNILSEFHRNPGYKVIAVYDSDPSVY